MSLKRSHIFIALLLLVVYAQSMTVKNLHHHTHDNRPVVVAINVLEEQNKSEKENSSHAVAYLLEEETKCPICSFDFFAADDTFHSAPAIIEPIYIVYSALPIGSIQSISISQHSPRAPPFIG